MSRYDVYGIGNALVDMEFEVTRAFLDEMGIQKGLMTLVDEKRQTKLIESMHGIQHKRSCGGSAGNSLIALAHLGGSAYLTCKLAADDVGDFYREDLRRAGVATHFRNGHPEGLSGRCMVFVTPDADRTMNTFLGVSSLLSRDDVAPDSIRESKYIYIEGYLVTTELGCEAACSTKAIAEAAGVKTSLTLSDPGVAAHFRAGFCRIIGDGVDLLLCNEAEAFAFTETRTFEAAVQSLKEFAKTFVVTRGARGAYVFDGGSEIHILAPKVEAIDTNGGGDLFSGCFLYGITHGHSYGDSGRLACMAASTLVTQFGARLRPEQIHAIRKDMLGF